MPTPFEQHAGQLFSDWVASLTPEKQKIARETAIALSTANKLYVLGRLEDCRKAIGSAMSGVDRLNNTIVT